MNIETRYQQGIADLQTELTQVDRRYNILSWARLVVFLLGAGLTYGVFRLDPLSGLLAGGAALLGFLYLIKVHSQVADRRAYLRRLRDIQAGELRVLAGDWAQRESGQNLIDPKHAFSYDLDLFGPGSLFQYLNRTATWLGRQRLAGALLAPEQDPARIRARQAAVRELALQLDWQLDFEATGREHPEAAEDPKSLRDWVGGPTTFVGHRWYPALIRFMPWVFFLSFALWIVPDLPVLRTLLGGWHLSGWVPLALFFGNLGIVGQHLKATGQEQLQVGRKSRLLQTYASLLAKVTALDARTPHLQALQAALQTEEGTAPEAIERLSNLSYMLDQRLNMIAGLVLNGIMLWDLRYRYKLEQWRARHQAELDQWFAVVGEADALVSLARLAANRPDFTWPEVGEGDFHYEAEALGHPLLDPVTRVDNDLDIGQPGEFLIITGANMAGKSTFLRTVGVNLLLAMAGGPVCARSCRVVPIELITSIRASDSLYNHESYFYAELKQLKAIIDKLKEGRAVFVIVDEMLRGTNSRDKQEGSRGFIEQLIRLRGVGLIATHDLSLGTLAEAYPGQARNKRFEVEIHEDRLDFDYRLRDGISQNLNATFLMQQMGIVARPPAAS